MKRRIAAVGKLLPWREADLADYLAGAPLQRTWDIKLADGDRAPCPHTEQEIVSVCCGAHEYFESDGACGRCQEYNGIELVCVACQEPMKEQA